MFGFIRTLLHILIAALVVWLALGNRQVVSFTWSPVHTAVDLPVYVLLLGGFAAGFVLGCFMVGLNSLGDYFEKGKLRNVIRKLEKKMADAPAAKVEAVQVSAGQVTDAADSLPSATYSFLQAYEDNKNDPDNKERNRR